MIPTRAALRRIMAFMRKESLQLLRDRATLGMLLGIPLLQLVVFGFAIELVPRSVDVTLVTAAADSSRIEHTVRQIVGPARIQTLASLDVAFRMMRRGDANIVIDARRRPVTVYIDASNPVLGLHAEGSIDRWVHAMNEPLLAEESSPLDIHVIRLYNPTGSTQPFLLTGLLGAIPTMSLVMMAALTIARERERGTLEAVRASPARFVEVAIGKLVPYLCLGWVQSLLILAVIFAVFPIRVAGHLTYILLAMACFTVANLLLGFLFSCLARQQMQAMQMTFFFFLPSSLLSGFMFPFQAMPPWARAVGECLPMTHYLRITRAVILRGAEADYVWSETLPIVLFAAVAAVLSLGAWRRRLA